MEFAFTSQHSKRFALLVEGAVGADADGGGKIEASLT